MLKVYKNSVVDPRLKSLPDIRKGSLVLCTNPDKDEIRKLGKMFSISEEDLGQYLDELETPRLDVENDVVVIVIRLPDIAGDKSYTQTLVILSSSDYSALITSGDMDIFDDIENNKIPVITTQRSKLVIQILLEVVRRFSAAVIQINKTVQEEKRNFQRIDKELIFTLVNTEEILNEFIPALTANINLIKKLLQGQYIPLYQQDKNLIDDLLIDSQQALDICITNLKTIRNLRDGYTTIITLRLNQIMKLLTYVTVTLTIPLIVANIYGMNILLPLADSPHAFTILVSLMFLLMIITVGLIIWYRKKI